MDVNLTSLNEHDKFVTDFELNRELGNISDDIMFTSLEYQINNSHTNSRISEDLLSYFNNRYTLLEHKYSDNSEFLKQIKNSKITFYTNVMYMLEDKFKLELNYELYTNITEPIFIRNIETIYRMFVLRHSELIKSFFKVYIFNGKREIADMYRSDTNRKDLEFSSLRKYLKDINDVLVVVNIKNVIESVITTPPNSFDIVDILSQYDPDELEPYLINNVILNEDNEWNSHIHPTFADVFFKPLVDNHFEYIPEIKNYFISIFPEKEDFH